MNTRVDPVQITWEHPLGARSNPPPPPAYDAKPTQEGGFGFPQANASPGSRSPAPPTGPGPQTGPGGSQDRGLMSAGLGAAAGFAGTSGAHP